MSDSSAEPLSPFDAATLWPQMGRLDTEVIATRQGESLLVRSGLAATRLTNLPHVRRTVVMGVRRGLGYRGVLVARELSGGIAWEVVSIRIARESDEGAIELLLAGVVEEVLQRAGRTLYLRYAEGSPHEVAIQHSGFTAYVSETLYAPPPPVPPPEMVSIRAIDKEDAYAVFRLYCQVSPEQVRRRESPTFEAWAAVRDSLDTSGELVSDGERSLVLWVGLGEREGRIFHHSADPTVLDTGLSAVESGIGPSGTLVVFDYQSAVSQRGVERGYTELGTRMVCARGLAITQTLEERVAVSEPRPIPQ